MKSICLLLLIALPVILCQNYVVPDLDYDQTDPTCDNINSLIAATSADITRLDNYVSLTLPDRSSKLNNAYASAQKTCNIVQTKTPSLIQTSYLRAENVKILEKLNNQVKSIAKSLDFGIKSSKSVRNLVQLKMNSVAANDLCDETFEAIIDLKNYLNFLAPAITETYIDGKLTDRLNRLQAFLVQCTVAACRENYEEEEAAWRHHEEEEAAWEHYEEEEAAWHRHHEEEEAIWHHYEEEEAAWHLYEEEEAAYHRHHEEEEAWERYEEEEAAWHLHEEEELALHRHHEEEEAAYHHWEEEEAAYHNWEVEEAEWHVHEEEEEFAAEIAAHGSDGTYTFYPTYDSNGGDITVLEGYSVLKLKAWCTANTNCLGFNDNGEVKSSIRTKDEWNQWTTDATKGFYLKKSTSVDYYLFYPNVDSVSNDITQLKGYSVADLKTQCSSRTNCQGFNTDGWLKSVVKTQSQWSSNTNYVNWGFYVRLSDFPVKHDYTSYMNKDSVSNDIIQITGVSVAELKTYCDANPACLGFNTDGWIKSVVKSQNQWSSNTNYVNWAFYVKGGVSAQQYNTESRYHFYPNQDSVSNDITQLKGYTVEQLKALCDANSACQGFNTDGWLKSVDKTESQWSSNTNYVNWGFYVKEATAPSIHDYSVYLNKDTVSNDIIQLKKVSVEDLKAACDANPACQGFNTDGWLKSVVKSQNQWSSNTNYVNWALYVKN